MRNQLSGSWIAVSLVFGVGAMAACSADDPPRPATPPRLVTTDGGPSGMEALMQTVLTVDANGCVQPSATWPRGTTLEGNADDFVLRTATGDVLARSGQRLNIGGGGVTRTNITITTNPDCLTAGTVWLVGSVGPTQTG